MHIHGIPIDEEGIRIDALANVLDDVRPRLIYVMPSYQNPDRTPDADVPATPTHPSWLNSMAYLSWKTRSTASSVLMAKRCPR